MSYERAVAIVGVGAILPDAPSAADFWENIRTGHYSISEVDRDRWDPALYYDPDPRHPEKTYSKIGGWVRDWDWDPLGWKLPIPPKVAAAMDDSQKWAVACTRMALEDAGWPDRALNLDRTAVIIGNALSGEQHYLTALRITFPELARELERAESFAALPPDLRAQIERELRSNMDAWLPAVSEDTMPGELGNCLAGRIANLFNFHGPNFIVDAACASALAAMDATVEGLVAGEFDVAITGGIDRNMGASTFVKFCAIGALSPTGTRPYAEGADGFVMGEGAALFVVKRLADAVRDGDNVYAVVRGIGSASDGKGKGITAPNPVGQRLAVERAWQASGLSPADCSLIEGHGTSTAVGDVVEVSSLIDAFAGEELPRGSIALGSVKSNIGHLKAAAGAAGMLKATLALRDKVLPPSLNFERPNPDLDWSASPFAVNTELRDWEVAAGRSRVAGVSAFGFGGTNFHIVMEEYMPEHSTTNGHRSAIAVSAPEPSQPVADTPAVTATSKPPLRGALVLGANTEAALAEALRDAIAGAREGRNLALAAPNTETLRSPQRIAIDFADGPDLISKAETALRVLEDGNGAAWPALRARGIHRGSGAPGKIAFLYTGQGSQYANMLAELSRREPVVAELFDQADAIMAPLLAGRRLSEVVFADPGDPDAIARAEAELRRTEITQPAVLTVDIALTRLLAEYGVRPDFVMGHSLGEYGALVASGAMSFEAALEAVSARGREMAMLRVEDPGAMAAVIAPLDEVQEIVDGVDGYVVLANLNSTHQVVLGGATEAVGKAVSALQQRGHTAIPLPVSHAFHTEIVAPASEPLRVALRRLGLRPPTVPIIANVDGELYPTGPDAIDGMLDILARQVASPVQFEHGLRRLYELGARIFVETGPKHALQGFADDVLGERGIVSLATNHPKLGDIATFNSALCGLWAAGAGAAEAPRRSQSSDDALEELFAEFLERGRKLIAPRRGTRGEEAPAANEPVVITGAALGLPGAERLFDDANVGRLLRGEQGIDVIPGRLRRDMLDKHVTRLVKGDDGGATFETIDRLEAVIKLAARAGSFDLADEFGVDDERVAALGRDTQLAIAAGIDALRDAGIPLVLRYKTTTKGTRLPDRWSLPDELRDETGVIFASAFPGLEEMTEEVERSTADRMRREQLAGLRSLLERMLERDRSDPVMLAELERRIHELERQLEHQPYVFDRRFLFRVLSMGHSQLAELIGARGPNTQINSACASTTQAVALAEDWIRAGRCRRVLIVAADDATSDTLMGWIGAGFLASGAAATDEVVEEAALPFDQRRHGMIIGMGAAALVVESAEAARERALAPICEVLGAVTANSAFHGTRLDVEHISSVMERLVTQAERRGVRREQFAAETMFVSHETYTPARGGSAAAEIHALRRVFGDRADSLVIANTKGFTGHPMGVGLEDVLAVKSLETGVVPPVPNFRDPDPELGQLNLSRGGAYPIHYALRLAAGFGSQIAMLLLRWTPVADGKRRSSDQLGFEYRVTDREEWTRWLSRVSDQPDPKLEVVQHRLRVAVDGAEPAVVRPVPVVVAVPEPAAPKPEPEPVAPAEPIGEQAPSIADVESRILALVAEQTGYPPDLLDMDLDLEADLGIDTVKQAEVFAAIREEYGIERDDSLKLRDYPTLAHVVGFVRERAGVAAGPEPAPVAPAEPIGEQAPSIADVESRILALVAEQTGYPPDLLDMDLDLEADLGIDTVKQAEVFAAIREEYGIERDDSLKLRDYPTLAHVVGFVRERAGVAAGPEPAPEPEGAAEQALEPEPHAELPEEPSGFPRRIPVPVLRPALSDCAPTGVAIGDGSRIVLMPDTGGIGTALTERLSSAGATVLALDQTAEIAEIEKQLESWSADGPIHGVYWLAAADEEASLGELDDGARRHALHVRVKLLAATMRVLSADPFLISATRLGGRHGYDGAGAAGILGGAVTGFTKALARERPDAQIKTVDFESEADPHAAAQILVDETVRDPGAVEIGYADGLRWSVGLIEAPARYEPSRELNDDTVFMVTGAAGSIVSAITADLAAAAGGGVFHLLDLVPEPDRSDPDLAAFVADRDALKRELADRIRQRGERPTPKLVERDLAKVERARAALDAIEAIEHAGGRVVWYQLDLTDADAVARAVTCAVEDSGQVDVLMHCAGLEVSHFLTDKPQPEYDLVFDVKAIGWLNLLAALTQAGIEPASAVVFSSIAGRFGNGGQTDYSAANDLLCKSVSHLRRTGTTRGIAIDWTAWAEIGMASRGSIPTMMKAAGIDMLSPRVGLPVVRRELTASGSGGEVVVAGSLGVLLEERHPTGGIDAGRTTERLAGRGGPMLGRIESFTAQGVLSVLTELDPRRQAFLDHHRIDGTPVLPGVMGIEAFAEIAHALLPGFTVVELDDVELLAPFKFYRDEPRTVILRARLRDGGDRTILADCELLGRRTLHAQEVLQTRHFEGRVRLAPEVPAAPPAAVQPACDEDGRKLVLHDEVYDVYFHGPAYQVLARAWRANGNVIGELSTELPSDHDPDSAPTEISPRLIELCFQTAGVWELGTAGRMALPAHIDRVVRYAEPGGARRLRAVVSPRERAIDAEVIDDAGRVLVRLEGYRTIELPGGIDAKALAPIRTAMETR